MGEQDESEQGTAEELVGRGGLWHVRETIFQVFYALERVVHHHLLELSSPATTTGLKAESVAKLISDEDVKFHWSIAAAGFDVDDIEVHETVLSMITVVYITIRVFAYANAWIEQYKQMQKKSTHRSKSLRKKLYTNKNS